MNCPYCAKEMESGYLRGGSGYELLWTEEPFKMTSLPTGNDFFVCKASDVYIYVDDPRAHCLSANLCHALLWLRHPIDGIVELQRVALPTSHTALPRYNRSVTSFTVPRSHIGTALIEC